MTVTAKWIGKEKLYAKLKALAPAADVELVEANRQSASEMASIAKALLHTRGKSTGKLKQSIAITPPGQRPPSYSQGVGGAVPRNAYMVTAGNTNVRYAHIKERGSKPHIVGGRLKGADHPGTRGDPFFFPAYRIIKKKHLARARKALKRSMEKVSRR